MLPVSRDVLKYQQKCRLNLILYRGLFFYTTCLFISHLIWPVTSEYFLIYKYSSSFPNEMKVMSPAISIFNVCVRVWGDIQPMFTRKHSQMGACPGEYVQQGAEQGWGACQEKRLPHPFKTPSSSAAHQQCRSWAVTHSTLLHHYPSGVFSIDLACHPWFFSDSSQITYITLSHLFSCLWMNLLWHSEVW